MRRHPQDRIFRAVADSTRRKILERLHQRELTVLELCEPFRITQPSLSKHLAVLRKVGLVAVHKAGQRRLYRLKPRELKPVHDWIQNFERFWTGHLDSIKETAELKAKQLAARDRAASSQHKTHSKEQRHGR